jgi:ADP-dependent NAD(P)H-hydrate dehydratase
MSSHEVTLRSLRAWPLPDPGERDDKEDRGRVLAIGGSRQIPGALLLAAEASLRAGAGKLQIGAPRDVAAALAIAIPEARVMALETDTDGEIAGVAAEALDAAEQASAVVIGPGMQEGEQTRGVAATVLARASAAVIDAGGLAAYDAARRGPAVITPHFGEMATLASCTRQEVAARPANRALEFAKCHDLVVVLKSATTYVASPAGEIWVHRGGSVGLGVSGSGDVLAGVIAGLIAQGAPVDQAAVWGVALHGAAGETLARRYARVGFLAREIAEEVPRLREVQRAPN